MGSPALAIRCPRCGAAPQKRCRTVNGHTMDPHGERQDAATAALGGFAWTTARYADGPRIAAALLPLTLDDDGAVRPGLVHTRRSLMKARDERSAIRFITADEWACACGLHPSQLPADVWTPKLRYTGRPGKPTLVRDDELVPA